MSNEVTLFSPSYLQDFTSQVFQHFGIPKKDAQLASEALSLADVRGIDSLGVARLHTYFEMLTLGRINPHPSVKIVRERKSVCTVDVDNGRGLTVAPKAIAIAMDRAGQFGSGR